MNTKSRRKEETEETEKSDRNGTEKIAVKLPTDLVRRLRQTAYHVQREDPSVTLVSIVELGIGLALDALEKKFGEAPDKEVKLRTGRRLKGLQ